MSLFDLVTCSCSAVHFHHVNNTRSY